MNKIGKKVKINWNDAFMFFPKKDGDTPKLQKEEMVPSSMETIGVLRGERDGYFIVEDPKTINVKTGKKHPEKSPTFYLIPIEMVESLDLFVEKSERDPMFL